MMTSNLSMMAIESQLAWYVNLVEFYKGEGDNKNLVEYFEGRVTEYEYKKEVCKLTRDE